MVPLHKIFPKFKSMKKQPILPFQPSGNKVTMKSKWTNLVVVLNRVLQFLVTMWLCRPNAVQLIANPVY